MGSSFVEDALKSNRNFHRLIISVSLVSIIFSLSLNLPQNLVVIKDKIDKLRQVNLLKYKEFAIDSAVAYAEPKLKSQHDQLEQFFKKHQWMVFHTNHISEKFLTPVHVGRILVEDTVLAGINSTNLTSLNAISSALQVGKNVQVVIPKIESILPDLEQFFNENAKAGTKVSSVKLGIDMLQTAGESFLPDAPVVHLYFELVRKGPFEAAPVFNAPISSVMEEVPDTSFINWLKNHYSESELFSVNKDGDIEWLSVLPNPPDGHKQEPIGLLQKRIKAEIEKGSPSKRSVTILGTSVPGVLVVYAAPLILMVLLYYLLQHSKHLLRLVEGNQSSFREFPWLPLVLGKYWWLEMVFSIVVLPLAAITILVVKLKSFGQEMIFETALSIVCAAIVMVCAMYIINNILLIRSKYGNE